LGVAAEWRDQPEDEAEPKAVEEGQAGGGGDGMQAGVRETLNLNPYKRDTMKANLTVIILMRAVRWLGYIAYWVRQRLEDWSDNAAVLHRDQVVKWARTSFKHYQLRTNHERSLLPLTLEDILAERGAA
jgi:hypothetical protein